MIESQPYNNLGSTFTEASASILEKVRSEKFCFPSFKRKYEAHKAQMKMIAKAFLKVICFMSFLIFVTNVRLGLWIANLFR